MREPGFERTEGSGYLAAAIGSFLGGVGSYVIMASVGTSDVPTSAFLSFGHGANLELEGVVILAALMVSTLLAVGGCWVGLWKNDHTLAATTALLTLILLAPVVILSTSTRWGALISAAAAVAAPLAARGVVLRLRRAMKTRPGTGDRSL